MGRRSITASGSRKANALVYDSRRIAIESWYVAGLPFNDCKRLKLKVGKILHTDEMTKEEFEKIIPARYKSRIDFMVDILEKFSITDARNRNLSFDYALEKYKLG